MHHYMYVADVYVRGHMHAIICMHVYRIGIYLCLYVWEGAIVLIYMFTQKHVCVYESHRVDMYACFYVRAIAYMSICMLLCIFGI